MPNNTFTASYEESSDLFTCTDAAGNVVHVVFEGPVLILNARADIANLPYVNLAHWLADNMQAVADSIAQAIGDE